MKVATQKGIETIYELYDHQREYLKLAENHQIVLLSGGVRNGKTRALFCAAMQEMYVKPPPPPGVPRIGWIVVPKFPMWESIKPEFEMIMGWSSDGGVILERNLTKPSYTLSAPDDGDPWEIQIKTADEPHRLRAATIRFVLVTESGMVSEEAFDILQARVLASKGTLLLESSPFGMNWMYHRLVAQMGRDPHIAVIKGVPIEANKSLDPAWVKRLRESYSSEKARQELDGEFMNWSGLIIKTFDRRKHIVDPIMPDKLPPDSQIICGLDFGYAHPTAAVYVLKERDKEGSGFNYTIVGEYCESGRTLKAHAESLRQHPYAHLVSIRYADPSAAQAQAEFEGYGLGCWNANNDVKMGNNCLSQLFEQGKLKVTRNCEGVIDELGKYHHKEGREEPVKVFDDRLDSARYAIFSDVQNAGGAPLPYVAFDEYGRWKIYGDDDRLRDEWRNAFGKELNDDEIPGGVEVV